MFFVFELQIFHFDTALGLRLELLYIVGSGFRQFFLYLFP